MDAYNSTLDDIKDEANLIFSGFTVSNGSAVLPVWDFGQVKNYHVIVDFNKWANILVIVGFIIVALAWLGAFSIIISKS